MNSVFFRGFVIILVTHHTFGKRLRDCGDPPFVPRGKVISQNASTATFACVDGFEPITRRNEAHCLENNVWSYPLFICASPDCYYHHPLYRVVYTGKINKTYNGHDCVEWASTNKSYGMYGIPESNYCRGLFNNAGPWCYSTYTPEYSVIDLCDVPMCSQEVPTCGRLPRLPIGVNPVEVTSGKRFNESDTIVLSCDLSFKPTNMYSSSRAVCERTGLWDIPRDICAPLNCYTVSGNRRGLIYVGYVSITKSNYTCQAWAAQSPHKHEHFLIEMGLIMETLEQAGSACRSLDGNPPWCYTTNPDVRFDFCDIPPCSGIQCGECPTVMNALCGHDIMGETCTYFCNSNAVYVRGNVISKCRNGQWDGTTIVCAPTMCYQNTSEFGMLYSGSISTTKSGRSCQRWTDDFPHKVDAIYRNPNRLTSDKTIIEADNYCRGFWDGKAPWCYTNDPSVVSESCDVTKCPVASLNKTNCGSPPDLLDAVPSDRVNLDTVIYTCKPGFNFIRGSGKSICMVNRLWSVPDIFCAPTTCYYHHYRHGSVYDGNVSETRSGLTCQKWSVDTFHVRAALAKNLGNYHVDKTWEEASNYCRGIKGIRDGIWCYTTDQSISWEHCDIPRCQVPDCGDPPEMAYASLPKEVNTTYSNSVSYTCDRGYKMKGHSAVITCLTNGQWSTFGFECIPVHCEIVRIDPTAVPILSATNHTLPPSVVFYQCRPGYKHIRGENTSMCDGNGRWSIVDVLCAPTTCYTYDTHATVVYAGTEHHNEYGVLCQVWSTDIPHTRANNTKYIENYNVDKTWKEAGRYCRGFPGYRRPWCYTIYESMRIGYCDVPICEDINCGPPPAIPGLTLLSVDHVFYRGTAKYACQREHRLVDAHHRGSLGIRCKLNGVWTKLTPKCAPTTCYRNDPDVGVLYAGTVSKTRGDIRCQSWDSNYPHHYFDGLHPPKELFVVDIFEDGLGNYCRGIYNNSNPPWCYTEDPNVRWDTCAIEKCSDGACFADEFECPGSHCIPLRWRCDRTADCVDGSDEKDCTECPPYTTTCKNAGKPRQFKSKTGQCCDCPRGLTGPHCEECDTSVIPCFHEGFPLLSSNCECQCSSNFTGVRCEKIIFQNESSNATDDPFVIKLNRLDECLADPVDIIVIIDGNRLKAQVQREHIVRTLKKLLDYFGNVKVGILTFNTKKIIQIDFKDFQNEQTLFQSFDTINFEIGNISLKAVLEVTQTQQLTLTNGKRLKGFSLTLIITGSVHESEVDDAKAAAREVRRRGIHVIVFDLSISHTTDFIKLAGISDNVFRLNYTDKQSPASWAQTIALTLCNVCDFGWTYYDGHCYKQFAAEDAEMSVSEAYSGVHWLNAQKKCMEYNSYLVTIKDKEEYELLRRLVAGSEDVRILIGLKRTTSKNPIYYHGMYRWVDGTPPTFLDWSVVYPGKMRAQPDGSSLTACVLWDKNRAYNGWMDTGCGYGIGNIFVCETSARNFTHKSNVPVLDPPSAGLHVEGLHTCANGELIWESRMCDGYPDCSDKSDERTCSVQCTDTQFRCSSGKQCISFDFYCDQIYDCLDKSDETMCVARPCASYEWRCSNHQCINISKVCDLIPDCRDGSDEVDCNVCKGFRCMDGSCIPYSWQGDGIVDCPGFNKDDEKLLNKVVKAVETNKNTSCHWRPHGVFKAMDRDFTHFNACDTTCDEGFFKCPHSYCIPVEFVCNGVADCMNKEDEDSCASWTCSGYYRCRKSRTCIHPDQVCDGNYDCKEGDDEMLCYMNCPRGCRCTGSVIRCDGSYSGYETFSSLTRKLDLSASDMHTMSDTIFSGLHLLVELKLSNCKLSNFKWNVRELKNLQSLDLSSNYLSRLDANTFSGIVNLRWLDISRNEYLISIEDGAFDYFDHLIELNLAFTGLKLLKSSMFVKLVNLNNLNVSNSKITFIEKGTFQNQKKLNYLDLDANPITDFYPNIFVGLDSLEYLQTGTFELCCQQVRPPSVMSDKCLAPQDEFSSCDDLMQKDVLRVFIWILGLSALLGNTVIVIYRIWFDKTSLSKGCGFFILNLGFSDFFMGVYMIIIGTADRVYRGKYLWFADEWKLSVWCKAAGFLSTMSSEASTMFICLVTLDRFLAIQFPFGHVKFNTKSYIVACIMAWLLAASMAVVPLFPATHHWNLYGRNSVCLALPLSRDHKPGWQFSTAVFIGFNFLAFAFIAVAQIAIYRAMKKSSLVKNKKRMAQERAVAKKLSLVVLTDFLCWFPVGIMGMLALGGIVITGEIYAWIAVFVLPVNSALNPFLYTLSSYLQKRQQEKLKKEATLKETGKSHTGASFTEDSQDPHSTRNKKISVGNPHKNMQPLSSYLRTATITDAGAALGSIAEALPFLQETHKNHEQLTDSNVFIAYDNKVLTEICFNVEASVDGYTLLEDQQFLQTLFQDLLIGGPVVKLWDLSLVGAEIESQ